MFANGVPAIRKIGFVNFIFGKTWMPGANKFGIFPMIIGSIYVTAGAIIIGVPIGLLCAIFMAKFCPPKLHQIMKPAVDLLAGIPSIVYGFFGLVVITPMIRNAFGGSGKNILTACILLGIMILPTIISVSESAIRAVPESYYEGALALGDTHERSVFKAVLPAAKSGILAAIILGIGRAIGETMAVIMIAGNHRCTGAFRRHLRGGCGLRCSPDAPGRDRGRNGRVRGWPPGPPNVSGTAEAGRFHCKDQLPGDFHQPDS